MFHDKLSGHNFPNCNCPSYLTYKTMDYLKSLKIGPIALCPAHDTISKERKNEFRNKQTLPCTIRI